MQLVDSHCHLDVEPLRSHRAEVLERARAAGVRWIVAPSYDLDSWSAVAALAEIPEVRLAFGLHPWVAEQPLDVDRLKETLCRQRAVAVGEIGLDAKVAAPMARQEEVLVAQLALARELDLPVLLHCRGDFERMLRILAPFAPVRGVLHAFARGPELAQRFLELGLAIGYGGAVTRANARRALRGATRVPLDRVLLETDAPSIGLEGVLAEEAEPRHVAQVAASLAAIHQTTAEAVAEVTTENARQLFRLD